MTKSTVLVCLLTISFLTVLPLRESVPTSCCGTLYIRDAIAPEKNAIYDEDLIVYKNENTTVHNNETRYIQNATVNNIILNENTTARNDKTLYNKNTTIRNNEAIYNENTTTGNETIYNENTTELNNETKQNQDTTADVVSDMAPNATSSTNSSYNQTLIYPTNSTQCSVNEIDQFLECGYRICLEPYEYAMENAIAHVEGFSVTFNCSSYKVILGGCLMICPPPSEDAQIMRSNEEKYSSILAYITLISLWISISCLALHLTAFVVVPDMRNFPGCCIACLCISLLSGYLSFLVGFDPNIISSNSGCAATCASTHFFLLSSVMWMNVMAFDVSKSVLHASGKLRLKCPRLVGDKKFYMCCLYAWGVSLVFTFCAIISGIAESAPEDHRPKVGRRMCWFNKWETPLAFFIVPVFTVICTNALFFGWCAYVMVSKKINVSGPHESALKENVALYGKLAVVMGLSLFAGVLASLTDVLYLWYMSATLNTLQGLFIFLTFTYTPKVKEFFLQRLGYENGKDNTQSEMSVQNSTLPRIV